MTEREIREVRERWDRAYDRLSGAQLAIEHLKRLEASLVAECKRLHDRTGLRAAGWFAVFEEQGQIERQMQSIGEAIRAMRDVHGKMQDRLIAIMGELQRRDALGTGKNDGEKA